MATLLISSRLNSPILQGLLALPTCIPGCQTSLLTSTSGQRTRSEPLPRFFAKKTMFYAAASRPSVCTIVLFRCLSCTDDGLSPRTLLSAWSTLEPERRVEAL